jgi:hypothetical protein
MYQKNHPRAPKAPPAPRAQSASHFAQYRRPAGVVPGQFFLPTYRGLNSAQWFAVANQLREQGRYPESVNAMNVALQLQRAAGAQRAAPPRQVARPAGDFGGVRHCSAPGCIAILNAVNMPFTCHYCGQQFCTDHRLPEKHRCAGLTRL